MVKYCPFGNCSGKKGLLIITGSYVNLDALNGFSDGLDIRG